MKLFVLALAALVLLLVAGVLGAVWLTRWLVGRAAERLSVEEFDAGLAIPMRDSDTRARRALRTPDGKCGEIHHPSVRRRNAGVAVTARGKPQVVGVKESIG
jgi:hypothetical protein